MRLPCSLRPICPDIGMKIAAVAGARHEPGANDEFAEAFAVTAPRGVRGEYRVEHRHDARAGKILAVKRGRWWAVIGCAEIEIVASGSSADQANLGEIGPRAAIRATGHADNDVVLLDSVRRQPLLQRKHEVG